MVWIALILGTAFTIWMVGGNLSPREAAAAGNPGGPPPDGPADSPSTSPTALGQPRFGPKLSRFWEIRTRNPKYHMAA